jgi:hypothetical protein
MLYRLGHPDLPGPFRAADAADGGSEKLGDIWRSWGHPGTVPRATVNDDPADARAGAAACHPAPFG